MATTMAAACSSDVTKHKNRKDLEFSLTEDEMTKINYLGKLERLKHNSRGLTNSKQMRFSEQLSLEAQIAMQLALKDTKNMKAHAGRDSAHGDPGVIHSRSASKVKFSEKQKTPQAPATPTRPARKALKPSSFSDVFQKRGSVRMSCDLTDENFEPSAVSKRSLDGMKVENALEIVEIVYHGEQPQPQVVDDDVITQIAQRNSVEKCLVWMEVLGRQDSDGGDSEAVLSQSPAVVHAKPARGNAGEQKPMDIIQEYVH